MDRGGFPGSSEGQRRALQEGSPGGTQKHAGLAGMTGTGGKTLGAGGADDEEFSGPAPAWLCLNESRDRFCVVLGLRQSLPHIAQAGFQPLGSSDLLPQPPTSLGRQVRGATPGPERVEIGITVIRISFYKLIKLKNDKPIKLTKLGLAATWR